VALLTAVLGAWLLVGAGSVHAQQGAVAGTVTDAETLQPVAGAQVFIPGTVVGTLTGERGTYRLEGVPTGQVTVTVRLIGYREISQEVAVAGGQVVTADFAVEQTALRLQDIIVTGVVGETPRVKLPFVVERLDSQDIPVPSSNVASLLTGKAAGVSVVRPNGQPGQAASVMLRGPTSIDSRGRTQGPLIVIDGVAQSANATLADIGALDIDHVEIVKGAAAASLYGARAGQGVIQITTKRGTGLSTNTFQIAVRGEYGLNQIEGSIQLTNAHQYKMNASQTAFLGSDAGTGPAVAGQVRPYQGVLRPRPDVLGLRRGDGSLRRVQLPRFVRGVQGNGRDLVLVVRCQRGRAQPDACRPGARALQPAVGRGRGVRATERAAERGYPLRQHRSGRERILLALEPG
jgi:TonB-dependent SusC/RagA subfamily outer membrane receptor